MAATPNFSATYLLLINILLLVCFDVLYYIHSLASAPRKILFFSLRRRSTTVNFSVIGLALAITLHKIVTNLVVHHESLVGLARDRVAMYALFVYLVPVIGGVLLLFWVVILAIAPVLKWWPAMRRMLRSGLDAPAEKHVPFVRWSLVERFVLHALDLRRQRILHPLFNEEEQCEIEKGFTSATTELEFDNTAEPDQVVLRKNAESRSICALVGLNYLWLLMAAIEWCMMSGEFKKTLSSPDSLNFQVMYFSFLSLYGWFDCFITWAEAVMEARRARL